MIREAARADVDHLIAFTMQEAREAEHIELHEPDVRRGVEAAFADPPLARYWIAEYEGRPIANISVVKEWSNFHGGHYWWVQSLFIVEDHRGRGLLEQLFAYIGQVGKAEGARDLRLYAHRLNERALTAYRRCGFTGAPYVMLVGGM
jgi:GNAT superfamily N-acetyltransferase